MDNWISVNKSIPDHMKMVLVTYNDKIVVGCYIDRWQEEACWDEDNYEYHDEKDIYCLKEGWYEQQDNWGEYRYIKIVEGEVTHWNILPSLPERENKND